MKAVHDVDYVAPPPHRHSDANADLACVGYRDGRHRASVPQRSNRLRSRRAPTREAERMSVDPGSVADQRLNLRVGIDAVAHSDWNYHRRAARGI